jgi:hypothetical protein
MSKSDRPTTAPLQAARSPRLVRRSAPHPALWGWQPLSRVVIRHDLLFDFAEDNDPAAEEMWTFPVADEGGLIDWVAWRRERPNRWWLMTGAAVVTAPWHWERAIQWGEPLRLAANPETWVADACRSACILQPDAIDLAYELGRVPLIECSEDLEAYFDAELRRQAARRIIFGRPA